MRMLEVGDTVKLKEDLVIDADYAAPGVSADDAIAMREYMLFDGVKRVVAVDNSDWSVKVGKIPYWYSVAMFEEN